MKANELRIGNLVTQKENRLPFEIQGIKKTKILLKAWGNNALFPIKDFEGIPLTEKWLVKFGFEKINEATFIKSHYRIKIDVYIENEEDIRVSITDGTEDVFLKYAEYIYIHQLQNLYFALTGRELEVK